MNRRGHRTVGQPGATEPADLAAYPSMSNQKGLPMPDGFRRPGGPAFQGGYDFGAGPAGGGASTDPLAYFQTGVQSGYDFGGNAVPTYGGVALRRAFPGGYYSDDWWGRQGALRGNYYAYARPFAFQGGYNWRGQSNPPRPDADRLANRYDGFRSGYDRKLALEVSPMNVYPRPDFPSGFISNRAYANTAPVLTAEGYMAQGYHEGDPCDFHFEPLPDGRMHFRCGSAEAYLRPSSCGYPRTLEIESFDCDSIADCVEFLRVGLDVFAGLHAAPTLTGAGNALRDAIGLFSGGNEVSAAGRPVVAESCPRLTSTFGDDALATVLMTADVAAGAIPQAQELAFGTAAGHMPGQGGPGRPFRQSYVVGAPQAQGLLTTQQLLSELVNAANGGSASLEVIRYTDTGEQSPHTFHYDAETQMFAYGASDGISTKLPGDALVNLYGSQPQWEIATAAQVAGYTGHTVGRAPQRSTLFTDKDGNPLNVGDAVKFAIEVSRKRRTGKGRVADIDAGTGTIKIRTTRNYKRPQGRGNKTDLEVTFPVSEEGVAFLRGEKKAQDLYVAVDS